MAMFGVSQRERYNAAFDVLSMPADVTAAEREATPGFFEGDYLKAAGDSVSSIGAMGAIAAADVSKASRFGPPRMAAIMPKEIDALYDEQNAAMDSLKSQEAQRLIGLRPDPKTNGTAVQALYGVAQMLELVAATAVTRNPALVSGAVYGAAQTEVGLEQGLDPATAAIKGGIEGLATGVGVALPASATGSLLVRALSGAGMNTAVGVTERTSISGLLKAQGYDEMAQQYAPLETSALLTEFVLGAAFGGALGKRTKAAPLPPLEVSPSMIDSALTVNESVHAELDAAPGIPVNTASRNAHAAAMTSAMDSLLTGRPVDVEGIIQDAGFATRPDDASVIDIIANEMEAAGVRDVADQLRGLNEQAAARSLPTEDVPDLGAFAVAPAKDAMVFEPAKVEVPSGAKVDGFIVKFPTSDSTTGYMELAVDGDRVFPALVVNGMRSGESPMGSGGKVTEAYMAAIRYAESIGKRFTSDASVTDSAQRVYQALERRGYTVERNPNARQANASETIGPEGRLVSDDGSPVFTVTAAPPDAVAQTTLPNAVDMHVDATRSAQEATEMAPAFEVAVECFLRIGG